MGALEGKVAIVTGAAQGIGRGVSLALAKAGADVAVVDLVESDAEQTAAELRSLGVRSVALACDVTSRESVTKAVQDVVDNLGPVWLLYNNAQVQVQGPLADIKDADLDKVLRSGVYGSLYMMQACYPIMKEQGGGRIVNTGSGGATMGLEGHGSYAITKEGIRGLTKVAATEWGADGITVNNIMPAVRTRLFDQWFEGLSPVEQKQQMEMIPLRRTGDAETDIGPAVVFLASEGGGFVTGRSLHVDGGRAFYDR